MIKEIIASTMLATSIGLQNTIIVQNVSRNVRMDTTSYWTENNEDDNGKTNRYYYRTTETQNPIRNESFEIDQRIIESYYHDEENESYGNEYILLIYGKSHYSQNETMFNKIDTIISGGINNFYQFQSGRLRTYKNDQEIQNQTLINFLEGSQYTTPLQYNNVLSELKALNYDLPPTFLTTQNYANTIQDYNLKYEPPAESQYIVMALWIRVEYDEQTPIDPYSPFGNYGKTINYQDIEFISDIPSTPQGEVIDIPGMLLMIIGMPFTFIAQSFNLTVFPGTMYEINIAEVFFAIIGAGIILFVIKKFLK